MAPRSALSFAHPVVRTWFNASFSEPTVAQKKGWPPIAAGQSTLLLAPTGSGKTLAAFLAALNRLMFSEPPTKKERCRLVYVSPLKALGVDVERNLRAPIAGIRARAEQQNTPVVLPHVGVRTGDTPSSERAKMTRTPPDILITTPESLYLMLTSRAREILRFVECVIVDEIHAMVPTKRGVHLFSSLERLEELRQGRPPLQRIGLSATQRPLDEVARLLGGGTLEKDRWQPRPVTVVDAGRKRAFDLTIEVPVEDMTHPEGPSDAEEDFLTGPASQGPVTKSIWPSIHPRLVDLIRAHRSTMVFVNSRRLAERLAAAINDLAEEEIALAHHGSIAKDTRKDIEDRLKRGALPAIVATSSLELGIDMGAVDLVIQIEAPLSVASGMQRLGRAGHRIDAISKGVVFPKFRGDLLASASVVQAMEEGKVEATYYPRNPLDVLAQQVVAMCAMDDWPVGRLFEVLRRSAPFAELPQSAFEGVLDMLSGRYPSDEFAELRPRITWDRVADLLEARQGAQRIAIVNGGTIADRGLYGVFLAGQEGKRSRRVGELDEEMVFESRPGDVFLLGASSWRIEDISHDRVTVTPAPGEPGRMPFWHGDRPGRSLELGRSVGALTRKIAGMKPETAHQRLKKTYGLDDKAATNLVSYVADQIAATQEVPSDKTVVFERFIDEIGDWRVCVLTPFGARVHAAWATAVQARLEDEAHMDVDTMWSDDGIVFRLPEAESAPDPEPFFLPAEEAEELLVKKVGGTSLFAARFRENAARALLLPKRHPQKRTPLWAQRKKSADLLKVAAQYDRFPIVLETYRECMKDVFDVPGLADVLNQVASKKIRIAEIQTRSPSPFAASLLFSYVANYIYDGDAPLAERRAQVLSIDHAQLKELLGEAELRSLLDLEALELTEARLQHLVPERQIKHADGLHDLLLSIGDLSKDEIVRRSVKPDDVSDWIDGLVHARRIVSVNIADEARFVAVEDAGKMRDALGIVPPPGLPEAFLEPRADALIELCARYARTHGPFVADAVAGRFGLGLGAVNLALEALVAKDKVVQGEMIPGGRGTEWCDTEVLRSLKRQSLAKLRKEVEPVQEDALARFLAGWQGVLRPKRGLDAVLNAIEQLQGAPLPASALDSEILPARVQNYTPGMLDELCAAGEVMWRGIEPIGAYDGRVALYLTDAYPQLAPPLGRAEGDLAEKLRALFHDRGALFFSDLARITQSFPRDLVTALWSLVWAGEVTNDTLVPMRSFLSQNKRKSSDKRPARGRMFRSRRVAPAGTEGRWSLLADPTRDISNSERRLALATQLLERYGVLVRESAHAEGIAGGFSAVYEVLKTMEESGKIRRGYFVAGLGATQFALPGAEDRLRSHREPDEAAEVLMLAATDPANPYGAILGWPSTDGAKPQRASGAQVIMHDGHLLGYLGRTERTLLTFLPEDEPERSKAARQLAKSLVDLAQRGGRRAILVSKIDGVEPEQSILAQYLSEAGFRASSRGFLKRRTVGSDA